MSTETTVGLAIAALLILGFVVTRLIHKREPKEKFFKCSRCGITARHTERTIKAWRDKKTKFFCQTCHAKWLETQPPRCESSSRPAGPPPSLDA